MAMVRILECSWEQIYNSIYRSSRPSSSGKFSFRIDQIRDGLGRESLLGTSKDVGVLVLRGRSSNSRILIILKSRYPRRSWSPFCFLLFPRLAKNYRIFSWEQKRKQFQKFTVTWRILWEQLSLYLWPLILFRIYKLHIFSECFTMIFR